MTQAAIYLRVSTTEQAEDGYGLDAQRAKCEAMATVKGWDIAHIFADEGISGTKDEADRPGLAGLLTAVESGAVGAVIVSSLDRIGRATRLVLRMVDRLSGQGVDLVSCKESLDTSTAAGRFVLRMFASLAELDRDQIVERTTDGRNARGRRDGEKGGRVPMGYERLFVDGKAAGVRVVDDEAMVVQEFFDTRAEGATLQQIADNLNARGIVTRRGAIWHPSSVRAVLLNEEAYRGGTRGDSAEHWPSILDAGYR